MMATAEEEAERALSIEELSAAAALGFEVAICLVCKRPTLWRQGPRNAEPLLCGRFRCQEDYGKIVRADDS